MSSPSGVNLDVELRNAKRVHTVSSTKGEFLIRRKIKRFRIDYGKYLVGRPYQLFRTAIRSEKTVSLYNLCLWYFCDHILLSTEEIVSKFGPQSKKNGKLEPNLKGTYELQKLIEDYVLTMQQKVQAGELTAGSCCSRVPPLRLFLDMNDITLNWKKINRLLPRADDNAKDEAYTREQIANMLKHSDLRSRIAILFLASSGIRLGGFMGLRDGDIKPIYDENDNSKLLAAHVVVYSGEPEEYDTFISPEAYKAYEEYRDLRVKFGEQINAKSPILLRRFNIDGNGKRALIDSKPASDSVVVGIIRTVSIKAGVRKVSENYNDRYTIKIAHGFRKFFNTAIRGVRTKDGQPAIEFIHKEWLMGHALRNMHEMEENYDRSDRIKLLLTDYLKVVNELTISDEERLKIQVNKLRTDISNMKSIDLELKEKDKELESVRSELHSLVKKLYESGVITQR